jgi:hypothetical protein
VLSLKPDWDEAFANMMRNQETVCDWTGRERYCALNVKPSCIKMLEAADQ